MQRVRSERKQLTLTRAWVRYSGPVSPSSFAKLDVPGMSRLLSTAAPGLGSVQRNMLARSEAAADCRSTCCPAAPGSTISGAVPSVGNSWRRRDAYPAITGSVRSKKCACFAGVSRVPARGHHVPTPLLHGTQQARSVVQPAAARGNCGELRLDPRRGQQQQLSGPALVLFAIEIVRV